MLEASTRASQVPPAMGASAGCDIDALFGDKLLAEIRSKIAAIETDNSSASIDNLKKDYKALDSRICATTLSYNVMRSHVRGEVTAKLKNMHKKSRSRPINSNSTSSRRFATAHSCRTLPVGATSGSIPSSVLLEPNFDARRSNPLTLRRRISWS